VGTNTEWGMLMANLSEDIGEETPLQVYFLFRFYKRIHFSHVMDRIENSVNLY
jgi:hypothetical protein